MFAYAMRHRHLDTLVPGVLTVAAYDNFYPISGWEKGKLAGIEVTLIEEFAAAAGLQLKLVRVKTWPGIWDKPRLGEADVAIGGIANAVGREHKNTEWTMPYYYVSRSLMYLKGTRVQKASYTPGSTGDMDAQFRLGELMTELTPSKGYVKDIPRLRSGKINGIMFGDKVSKALIADDRRRTKKKDLVMKIWEIVPTLVPTDGETYSFPTRLGSGIAVSLTAFMVHAADSGRLKKLCSQFSLDYPVTTPGTGQTIEASFKPFKELKSILRNYVLSFDTVRATNLAKNIKIACKHFKSLTHTHDAVKVRTKAALGREDVADAGLFMNAADTILSWVSYSVTNQYDDSPVVTVQLRSTNIENYVQQLQFNTPTFSNMAFLYITYKDATGDAPLFHYKKNVCTINGDKAMAEVRKRGNTLKDMDDVCIELGRQIAGAVISEDSGLPNAGKLLGLV